jgi:hypothetical protein
MVKRVAPFEGQVVEGFENVADASALTNLMGGLAAFTAADGTGLTVQDGTVANAWDQHAFEERCFLGGSAARGVPATIEITFASPVSGFGGAFGHRVHPLFDTTQDTEFVFYDDNGKEVGRDKILIGSLPGAVSAHWKFTRGVKRVTFSCVSPMADALTVRLSPVSYRKFTRNSAKAAAGG